MASGTSSYTPSHEAQPRALPRPKNWHLEREGGVRSPSYYSSVIFSRCKGHSEPGCYSSSDTVAGSGVWLTSLRMRAPLTHARVRFPTSAAMRAGTPMETSQNGKVENGGDSQTRSEDPASRQSPLWSPTRVVTLLESIGGPVKSSLASALQGNTTMSAPGVTRFASTLRQPPPQADAYSNEEFTPRAVHDWLHGEG